MIKANLTSDNTTIKFAIDDCSQTAKDFLSILPLSLKMNNYDGREFYGVIKPLSEDGPTIPTFKNGDVTYYTTGKSLAIFFGKDNQSQQTDLIKIGEVISDLNEFKKLGQSADVKIEVDN